MKRKIQDSTTYSCVHVQERAKERYGLTLSAQDYTNLNKLVLAQFVSEALPLSSDNDTEIYEVPYKNKDIIAVFHKSDRCVTTLLPPGTVIVSRRNRRMK